MLICYADDSGIWYKITDEDRDNIVDIINSDLHNLSKWALDNNTTFEPTKTHFSLISGKHSKKFDPSGIVFEGVEIARESQLKLVGYLIDEKLTWGPMIDKLAKKARQRLGILTRI